MRKRRMKNRQKEGDMQVFIEFYLGGIIWSDLEMYFKKVILFYR